MSRAFAARSRLALLPSVAILTLIAGHAVTAAELYKWTDSKGVVHYSDTPPPKDQQVAERLRIARKENSETGPGGDTKLADKVDADPTKPGQTVQGAASVPQENRKQLCNQARSTLDVLHGQTDVADAVTGKPLDEKERASRTANAQFVMNSYCANPS